MSTSKELKNEAKVEPEFSLDQLSQILKMLKENSITEFRLDHKGVSLYLRRAAVDTDASRIAGERPVIQLVRDNITKTEQGPVLEQSSQLKPYLEVSSPMVGTFYRRPAVDSDPYFEVGDVVKKGDVLCIIEAMKIMNEIKSDISGRIVEVCLDDGQMAEYNEVLFRIDPAL